ncbi:MAG: hypothetical protein ACMXYK_02940 [Candidatus Woesearchaeota archaeon]
MVTHIIAYGGSIVCPKKYDMVALKALSNVINIHTKDTFIIVIGGGYLARDLQKKSKITDPYAKDWVGIAATRINAEFVRKYLQSNCKNVHPEILLEPKKVTGRKVYIAGGWKPGASTDYDAIRFAKAYNAKKVYKISNISDILDVKPQYFDKTKIHSYKKLKTISWSKINNLVGKEWIPGINTPLDPPAAKLGKELGKKEFSLYLGKKEDLEAMISGTFKGTIIKNRRI